MAFRNCIRVYDPASYLAMHAGSNASVVLQIPFFCTANLYTVPHSQHVCHTDCSCLLQASEEDKQVGMGDLDPPTQTGMMTFKHVVCSGGAIPNAQTLCADRATV